jgi:hypothetical protein
MLSPVLHKWNLFGQRKVSKTSSEDKMYGSNIFQNPFRTQKSPERPVDEHDKPVNSKLTDSHAKVSQPLRAADPRAAPSENKGLCIRLFRLQVSLERQRAGHTSTPKQDPKTALKSWYLLLMSEELFQLYRRTSWWSITAVVPVAELLARWAAAAQRA